MRNRVRNYLAVILIILFATGFIGLLSGTHPAVVHASTTSSITDYNPNYYSGLTSMNIESGYYWGDDSDKTNKRNEWNDHIISRSGKKTGMQYVSYSLTNAGKITITITHNTDWQYGSESLAVSIGNNNVKIGAGLVALFVNDNALSYSNVSWKNDSTHTLTADIPSFAYNTNYSVRVEAYAKWDNGWGRTFHYKGTSRVTMGYEDYTAPTGTLTGVTNGGVTNSNVTFKWNEAGATATLDGYSYSSGAIINTEGYHVINISDKWGNVRSYTFTIDKTPPKGTLSGVTNGGFTNSNVTFKWTEAATATLDGKPYTTGATISAAGSHTIILTDTAGNKSTYTFTIDRTPPSGKLYSNGNELGNGGYTRYSTYLSWSEANVTAVFSNGNPYTNNAVIYAEGYYYITLTDRAGNNAYYSFTIDKTAPTGILNGVENNGITNKTVTLSWTEAGATAKLDGAPYSSGAVINAEGAHEIILTDRAGNVQPYTFTIDKTSPEGILNGVTNGDITNKTVRFTWTESSATATLDGSLYTSNTAISAEGMHEIVLTDRAGNNTYYSFTIDKTAPIGALSGVTNGGATNQSVFFNWTESSAIATLDGVAYTSGTLISMEGTHEIILTDRAGNSSIYTFTIDLTPPVGSLNGVENRGITNKSVTFSWSESRATATLDGNPYNSGTTISTEGTHEIILTDMVGNSSRYSFEIDKTAPIGELIGVDDGGTVNTAVYFRWYEEDCTVTVNGTIYSYVKDGNYYRCLIDTDSNTRATFNIILTDRAGNKASYTCTIDKRLPTGTLRDSANNVLSSGAVTNKNISLIANSSNITITVNGQAYTSGTILSAPDNKITIYTFSLTDALGNFNSYTVTVNKVRPTIEFYKGDTILLLEPNTTYYFNTNIRLSFDSSYSITCNSRPLSSSILTVGDNEVISYTIKVTNQLGNTNTYTIELDTVPYLRNYNELYKNYRHHINKWWETYTYTLTNNQYVQGAFYAFSSITDVNSFAFNREMGIAEYHQAYNGGNIYCDWAGRYVDSVDVPNVANMLGQPYYIYRDANNSSKIVAYFNISNLNAAVNKYAAASIKLKTIPSTPATEYPGDMFIDRQQINTEYIYINTSSFSLPFSSAENTLIVNGRIVDYSYILTEGVNTVIEIDRAGNETKYLIMLDTAVPEAAAFDFAGNSLGDLTYDFNTKTDVYYNNQFRLFVNDLIDGNCLITITTNSITTKIFSGESINYFDFKESGIYTISWEDIAGNKKETTLYLSLITPSIIITEEKDSMDSLVSFNVTLQKNLSYNQILSISVWFATDGGDFEQLHQDGSGTNISPNTLTYAFQMNGKYRIIIIDRFGTEITQEYEFHKNAPTGSLYTKDNAILPNGAKVNTQVKFSWKDPYSTAFLNGAEYTKDSLIVNEGEYTIELRDKSGNITIYTFTIDKTPPAYTLNGVEEGGATNQEVSISWDETAESGASAQIKKGDGTYNVYTNGAVISAEGVYSIKITDAAGNSKTITFTIDKTAPDIIITDSLGKVIKSDSIVNVNIKVTWTGAATVYVNGQIYEKGATITADGLYTIFLEDKLGNTNTARIRIDKTINPGELIGVENGGYTNQDVFFSWSDTDVTATLNGQPYVSGTAITVSDGEAQSFTIVMTDRAGNKLIYEFTISKQKPAGKFSDTLNNAIDSNSEIYTSKSLKFTWTTTGTTATLNGNPYSSGTTITIEGVHVIVLTDRAGNSTVYTFTIDKTVPIGELIGVENGGYTNRDVSLIWSESGLVATLNGAAYNSGNMISIPVGQAKIFTILLTDRAGNSSTYTFTIDRVAPTGKFEDFSSKVYDNNFTTNKSVFFSWAKSYTTATLDGQPYIAGTTISAEGKHQIVLTDRVGNTTVYDFIIDKSYPTFTIKNDEGSSIAQSDYYNQSISFSFSEIFSATLNGQPYMSGILISIEGNYIFILKNEVGSSTTFSFVIDITAPSGILSGVEEGGVTRSSVTFTWSEPGANAFLNGIPYSSGAVISAEGRHEITLTDRAGNSTIYTFEIDKTAPIGELNGVSNGGHANQSVIFIWSETGATATLNGTSYISGTPIAGDGDYEIILIDLAGNSSTYTFSIKTSQPVGELIGVREGGVTSKNVSFVYSGKGLKATLNGQPYISGTAISAEGSYTITLTDAAGNSTYYNFSIYKQSVYYELIGVNSDGYTNDSFSIVYNDYHAVTINGIAYYSGTTISAEGIYNIIVRNISGAQKEFTVIIDKTDPEIQIYDDANNLCSFNTNKSFRIVAAANDIKSIIINGEPYNNSLIFKEGEYTIVVTDKAGNEATFYVTVNKTPPTGNFNIELINNTTANDIVFFFDAAYSATLNGAPYYGNLISTPVGTKAEFTIVLQDEYGNQNTYVFTINKLIPKAEFITQSGQIVSNGSTVNMPVKLCFDTQFTAWLEVDNYISETWLNGQVNSAVTIGIKLMDKLGNTTYYTITIDLTVPSVNESYSSEFDTNDNVKFTWDNDTLLATLNGDSYIAGTIISAEGYYEFVLTNAVGNVLVYRFTIDKTTPEIVIDQLRDNNYVTSSTTIKWDERGLTVTVNGEVYEKGSTISKDGTYEVIAVDRAGNITKIIFVIDKSKPNVSVNYKGDNTELVNNKTYYSDVTLMSPNTIFVNGFQVESGTVLHDGIYTIEIVTLSGIKSSFNITIKKPTEKAGNTLATVLINTLVSMISVAVAIVFGILIYKTIKNNKKGLL